MRGCGVRGCSKGREVPTWHVASRHVLKRFGTLDLVRIGARVGVPAVAEPRLHAAVS